jgi:NADPH:quinone reductase-like Zn-dependent oxidoreductase
MDISQREGKYPSPPGASTVLGVEFSGIIAELGPNIFDCKVGDQVLGLVGGVSIQFSINESFFEHFSASGCLCRVYRVLGETCYPEARSFILGGGS